MDVEQALKDFQDHLAPRLDTYEQAIYLFLFRHTRLVGVEEAVIGFKSARRRMACGIGEKGKPMLENTAYEKLQSLQKKGCIVILDSNRDGRRIRFSLPSEIPDGVVIPEIPGPPDIETEDFFRTRGEPQPNPCSRRTSLLLLPPRAHRRQLRRRARCLPTGRSQRLS